MGERIDKPRAAADVLAYAAPRWLRGAHAQTIYPYLRLRTALVYRRERIDTPDGDFIDFDWLEAADLRKDAPVVVLFHGLEGNSRSHYALTMMAAVQGEGWRGVVPHFRGCSGEPNRLPRAYHSGDYAEVGWILQMVRAKYPRASIHAIGVSLGASALLNWLGREAQDAARMVSAAVAVSAPLDLTAAGYAIGRGANRIYAWHFLHSLKPKALAMAKRFPRTLDMARIRAAWSMFAFDDAVTAPLHGFAGATDYWMRASSKRWLSDIAVPTLVINAKNDPFIPASSLPTAAEVSHSVTLEQPEGGGHCGFLQGPLFGQFNWLPRRIVEFLRLHAHDAVTPAVGGDSRSLETCDTRLRLGGL